MFTMKKQGLSSAIVVLCGVLVLAASAPAITVDLFEKGALAPTYYQPPSPWADQIWVAMPIDNVTPPPYDYDYSEETGLIDVLGGSRKIELEWESGNHGNTAKTWISANGTLKYNNGTGLDSVLTATYDGSGFGSGIDFTDSGLSQSLLIKLLSSDLGADFTINVLDADGTVGTFLKVAPQVDATPYIMAYDFVDFAADSSGDGIIDWENIMSVQYIFDAKEDGDYEIDLLGTGTIPEPMTMSAVFASLAGLGGYLRRRRS